MSTHPVVPSPANGTPPSRLPDAALDVQVPVVPDTIENELFRGSSCEILNCCQSPPAQRPQGKIWRHLEVKAGHIDGASLSPLVPSHVGVSGYEFISSTDPGQLKGQALRRGQTS